MHILLEGQRRRFLACAGSRRTIERTSSRTNESFALMMSVTDSAGNVYTGPSSVPIESLASSPCSAIRTRQHRRSDRDALNSRDPVPRPSSSHVHQAPGSPRQERDRPHRVRFHSTMDVQAQRPSVQQREEIGALDGPLPYVQTILHTMAIALRTLKGQTRRTHQTKEARPLLPLRELRRDQHGCPEVVQSGSDRKPESAVLTSCRGDALAKHLHVGNQAGAKVTHRGGHPPGARRQVPHASRLARTWPRFPLAKSVRGPIKPPPSSRSMSKTSSSYCSISRRRCLSFPEKTSEKTEPPTVSFRCVLSKDWTLSETFVSASKTDYSDSSRFWAPKRFSQQVGSVLVVAGPDAGSSLAHLCFETDKGFPLSELLTLVAPSHTSPRRRRLILAFLGFRARHWVDHARSRDIGDRLRRLRSNFLLVESPASSVSAAHPVAPAARIAAQGALLTT